MNQSPREEAQQILGLVGNDVRAGYEIVERQLAVVVLRTQVMLSLSGIVITVTGFSGRAVAETSLLARDSIACGIFFVLAAAAVAIGGVLRLRWLTQIIVGEPSAATRGTSKGPVASIDPLETLARGLQIRNAKSRYLGVALLLFLVGFSLYCLAIAQLLIAQRPG
jgi:hypothetical protein